LRPGHCGGEDLRRFDRRNPHAHRAELNTTYDSVDAVAGLADRHTSKLLCGLKGYGPMSLTVTLQTLGLALIVVSDDEALERVRSRLTPRYPQGRHQVQAPAGLAGESRWGGAGPSPKPRARPACQPTSLRPSHRTSGSDGWRRLPSPSG
jgi:hypothetical protein